MREASLDSLLTFNDELLALAAAGLPLELGFSRKISLRASLEKLGTQLTMEIGRGKSFDHALSDATYLPDQYRTALATWLHGDLSTVAHEGPAASSAAMRHIQDNMLGALVQVLILLGLVYCAFLYLCSNSLPHLAAMYSQSFLPLSPTLRVLMVVREWMPIWAWALPIISLLLAFWIRQRIIRSKYHWLPGGAKYFDAIRHANYADLLAELLDRDLALNEALAIAGPISSGSSVNRQAPSARARRDVSASDASSELPAQSSPSLVRWALTGDLAGESRSDALRLAASVYRKTAHRQAATWSAWISALVGVLIGGALVFAYALSLFVPVVELLHQLTKPGGI